MKFTIETESRIDQFEAADPQLSLVHPIARSAPRGAHLLDDRGELLAVRIVDRTDDGFLLAWFGPFFCDADDCAGQISTRLPARPADEGEHNASADPATRDRESAHFAVAPSAMCGASAHSHVAPRTTATRGAT